MASRYYKYDKDKKKMVEFNPNNKSFSDGAVSNHINMRKTWSGTTKIEFNTTTIDEAIKRLKK